MDIFSFVIGLDGSGDCCGVLAMDRVSGVKRGSKIRGDLREERGMEVELTGRI